MALPQEVGSNLEEFVGNLGMQPVACPWNGVVVHVQEVLLKKLEILVGHVVAFASPDEQRGKGVQAQFDVPDDVVERVVKHRNVEPPRKPTFLFAMQPFHQKRHQDGVIVQGAGQGRLDVLPGFCLVR